MKVKGRCRGRLTLAGLSLLFALACRVSPRLSDGLLRRVSRPAMAALNRLTARVPFPVSEALTFAIGVAALCALIAATLRAVAARRVEPLRRWLRGAVAAALALILALEILWLPAMLAPFEPASQPETGPLEWLCGELIGALNAALPDFPPASETLRRAPEVAGLAEMAGPMEAHGLPACTVKAVRYPEWMRAASISGLFVPLTGEALVDAGAPEALLPFTAVHELMHLAGIADEGAANIAAWARCIDAGGAFAASARLWALRYALGLLRRADADAWQRARGNMKDPLAQVFDRSGGEAAPGGSACPGLPGQRGPALTRGDYAALVGWLCRK